MFIFAWIILVMLSRIVVGAHFASDVTMGVVISFSVFLFLKARFLKEH